MDNYMDVNHEDRIVSYLPLSHIAAQVLWIFDSDDRKKSESLFKWDLKLIVWIIKCITVMTIYYWWQYHLLLSIYWEKMCHFLSILILNCDICFLYLTHHYCLLHFFLSFISHDDYYLSPQYTLISSF